MIERIDRTKRSEEEIKRSFKRINLIETTNITWSSLEVICLARLRMCCSARETPSESLLRQSSNRGSKWESFEDQLLSFITLEGHTDVGTQPYRTAEAFQTPF